MIDQNNNKYEKVAHKMRKARKKPKAEIENKKNQTAKKKGVQSEIGAA